MTADPSDFYRRRVPAQWNRALEAQEAASASNETAARTLAGMKAVNATIRVIVRGGAAEETFDLAIADGHMSADAETALPPFMTLAHDLAAFAVLERESGDSVLGFLGGMAGLEQELKLTAQRLENLAGLEGTLAFELTGEGGFALLVHFGEGEVADEPRCKIEIAREAYEQLRRGELNPQEAFMNGQIVTSGEMQMAMQLALAAMTPD